jgi:hypothetical protein
MIFVHEQGLSDGGTGLTQGQFGDGAFEFEGADTHAYGAAGYQQDLAVLLVQLGNLMSNVLDIVCVNAAVFAEGGGADFDNKPFDAA